MTSEEIFDPRFVVVGDQTPPPPPAPPEPPKEKVVEDKLRETERAYHELAGEAAALRKLLGDMMQSRGSQQPSATPTTSPVSSSPSWSDILSAAKGGSTSGEQKESSPPSLDDIQRLTRHEIAQTVQAIQYQQQVGQALLNDFYTNHTDLIPYANIVARLVQYGDPSKDITVRYREAIQEVRSMQESGALPKHQPPAQGYANPVLYGRMPPVLYGGQGYYGAPVRTGQDTEGIEYGDEYLKNVLKEWTDYRKRQLAKRKWQDTGES